LEKDEFFEGTGLKDDKEGDDVFNETLYEDDTIMLHEDANEHDLKPSKRKHEDFLLKEGKSKVSEKNLLKDETKTVENLQEDAIKVEPTQRLEVQFRDASTTNGFQIKAESFSLDGEEFVNQFQKEALEQHVMKVELSEDQPKVTSYEGRKAFKCLQCPKSFKTAADIMGHVGVHTRGRGRYSSSFPRHTVI
jgi:hypothetical protein